MATQRYQQLRRRLRELEKNLLPQASPTGNYTPRQLDRVRGYRLLAHAEIEAFVEDRVRQVASGAWSRWLADQKSGGVVISLLTFCIKQDVASHKHLRNEYIGTAKRTEDSLRSAVTSFEKWVTGNHGVREHHLLKLLLPVGVKRAEIDPAWMATIDTFGSNRGQLAHSSVGVQQPPDPKTELQTVELILKGLENLDETLAKLKR